MGEMLQVPLRHASLLLRVTMFSFDGDVVYARGRAGDLTVEMEIDAHKWEHAGGVFENGASIEVVLV